MGSVTLASNLVSSLLPFMGTFSESHGVHFVADLAPFALLAFVGSFFLPNTLNKRLKD